jgi:hypothetical protein
MGDMTAVLLGFALLGGTAFTLLFDDDAPVSARVAAGVPIGLALLGLSGFVAASLVGMGAAALAGAALGVLWPVLAVAVRAESRRRMWTALRPGRVPPLLALGFLLLAALLWRVYDRAMFVTPAGAIATGDDHNIGDLPFHLGIVAGFVDGDNYPPQHPELAGTRLTYPFLADMVSALLVRAGASLPAALFWPNVLLAVALVVLLYHWGLRLTRDRLAAAVTPALVLFSGGLGFMLLKETLAASDRPWQALTSLPRDYTIAGEGGLRWGNALTTLLIPQRSLLLGLPLFLAVATWWWRAAAEEADERRRRRLLAGAGAAAALLPLAHAHSFVLALGIAAALALFLPAGRSLVERSKTWAAFFLPPLVLALPQVAWSARGSALQARSFLAWHLGWDRGDASPISFWLFNTGLFIPLLVLALLKHRRWLPPHVLRFYAPFALCFVVPNFLRLSPWIWDNIKFLFYWYVASAPLVGVAVARMARGPLPTRIAAPVVLAVLVLAGALDVSRVAGGRIANVVFDADAVAFGAEIARVAPPGAVIAAWPTHDSPVLLSGRPALLGYVGHIWSQGLQAGSREQDLESFYAGRLTAADLRSRYNVAYALLGPREIGPSVGNAEPWQDGAPVASVGGYRLVPLPGS